MIMRDNKYKGVRTVRLFAGGGGGGRAGKARANTQRARTSSSLSMCSSSPPPSHLSYLSPSIKAWNREWLRLASETDRSQKEQLEGRQVVRGGKGEEVEHEG